MGGDIRHFRLRHYVDDTTDANFIRDGNLDDQPNADSYVELTGSCVGPEHVHRGTITRIHLRLIPTNAVTFQIAFYGCRDGAAGTNQLESDKLFDSTWQVGGSPDPLVADTEYVWDCLCTPFCLCALSRIYYNIAWSAAPGNTVGYISVEGRREAYDDG